jgi:hypothetical protein
VISHVGLTLQQSHFTHQTMAQQGVATTEHTTEYRVLLLGEEDVGKHSMYSHVVLTYNGLTDNQVLSQRI